MRITVTMFWLGLAIVTFGQKISLDVQAVASGYAKDDQGRNVDWTLGVPFAQVIQENHHLTEGFQQGHLLLPTESEIQDNATLRQPASNTTGESLLPAPAQFALFPNPSDDILYLSVDHLTDQPLLLIILNTEGRPISRHRLFVSSPGQLLIPNISKLPSGLYFIQVKNQEKTLQTLRFIKQ